MDHLVVLSLCFFILGCACDELDEEKPVVEQNQQLQARLQAMEDKMNQDEHLKKESDAVLNRRLQEAETEIVSLKKQINRMDQVGVVAFNVKRTTNLGPVSGTTLIAHDTVDLNIGGAYEPTLDVFTAPVDGVYYFHTHHSYMNDFGTLIQLKVNSVTVMEKWGGDEMHYSSSDGSIITELVAGDIVGVYLYDNNEGRIYCQTNGKCMFGGWLLYETIA